MVIHEQIGEMVRAIAGNADNADVHHDGLKNAPWKKNARMVLTHAGVTADLPYR